MMTISLPPDLQQRVDEKVREGAYASPEELVRAALDQFLGEEDDFTPGELNALLAEGTADLNNGQVHDGEAVFQEIRQLSAERRQGRSS